MNQPPVTSADTSLNGRHPAPPPASGGAVSSRRDANAQGTIFPDDLAALHPRTVLYLLGWAQLLGQTLLRWLWIAGFVLTAAILLSPLPGKLWWIAALFTSLALITIARFVLAQRQYVRFAPETASGAPDNPQLLPAGVKLPLHVTGTLAVNNKQRAFLWLPGFYRTFATREHALLCLCRDRRLLAVGATPEADTGLWYAFWQSDAIRAMERGSVKLATANAPGIRLVYTAAGKPKRLGGAPPVVTLYLACASVADRERIWQDLSIDRPANSASPLPTPVHEPTANREGQ